MVGSRLRKYLWLITKKASRDALPHKGFHFGEIVAPPDKLNTVNDPKRTLNIDAENYDWLYFKETPTVRYVTNNLLLTYSDNLLVLTRPTKIVGFHPAFGSPNPLSGPGTLTQRSGNSASYDSIS
ncbi:uncharacterized protein PGRI_080080 [Penicillium griseofulvum]|uniref:Uncharacterized protein n=1 Tax=Penicillium patulum TaxID=5078 RepID=A0A135LUW1_PENPA|nr:uncharacterized protein PGRI_080080 [Penicillium griseofulvum]KXG52752.1 hypothetical protein PGRI_080080 [Penicillium griseofulvum]